MPPFFESDLTEAVSTDLAAVVPSIGDSWTQQQVTGTRFFQATATGLRASGNAGDSGFIYVANAASGYPTANYEVQVTLITAVSSIVPIYVIARNADQENMYAARLVTGDTCQLYKKVAGTWTTLGSTFATPAANSVCKLSVNGTAIKFYDDGVEVASATDSSLSATGKGGLAEGGGAELVTSTDDVFTTIALKDFSITDLGGGGGGDARVFGALQPMGIW